MTDPSREIDEIDAKILRDLLRDGRKEFTQIANEVGVSKDIIWQHYRKMKKQGLIVGATIQLNYTALGYDISTNFYVSVALEKQDEVIAGMQKIPGVYDAYRCGCSSELWAIGTLKNMAELEYVKQSIKKLPGVLGLRTEIWTGIRNNKENLSILHTKGRLEVPAETELTKRINNTNKPGDIDDVDMQIIEKLAADGRVSFNRVAKELKISTDTVTRRYNKLKKDRVIKSLIQINPIKLGYACDAIISIAVASQDNLMQTIETLEKIPDIIGLWKIVGVYDLGIYAEIRNIEQLIALQDQISELPTISKMELVMLNRFTLMPYPKEHMSDF